jgi:transcriptional pleiotropic regulator of transition state genes
VSDDLISQKAPIKYRKWRNTIMMKSLGIVRKVDELGRIVLPIELRRKFDIEVKDSLEIYTEGDTIILKKYEPACIFCGDASNVINYNGKNICPECIKHLQGFVK